MTRDRLPRNLRADRRYYPQFVGVDGEGGNIDGLHKYLLLRAGNDAIEEPGGLSMSQSLGFLADLPSTSRIYVSFAFDYDVTMMLRQASSNRWERLFNRAGRERLKDGVPTGQYYPVEFGDFEVDYMPRKEFKVRRKGETKYTVIHDVFTFFQSSFVKALKKWFPEDKYADAIERIAIGKEQRHDFGAVTEDEREYNILEIKMLESLMSRFRDMCFELDIFPRKWQGPGNLVTAVFRREGMPRRRDIVVPSEVLQAANDGYVAGRFECRTYGEIDQHVWQYDINSAYASYYRELPCLLHGEWRRSKRVPPSGHGLYRVTFNHPSGLAWNTLPVRSETGTILFPKEGTGWYWTNELRVAQKYGCELTIHDGFNYVPHCGCEPFDWVYQLYDMRADVGKESGKGKVLKIVLATIYGKVAQSVGNPPYSNPIWAGLITSSCRAKLIDATLSVDRGRHVHMLATDGLFSTSPIASLPVGKNLGEWELTEHDNMFIVQSGVYFLPGRQPKTRGVPVAKVTAHESDFRSSWKQWRAGNNVFADEPSYRIPLTVFISLRVARQWGKPFLAGRWLKRHKTVRFDWWTKRINPRFEGAHVITDPIPGSSDLVSQPPKRMVGGDIDDLGPALSDAPDWADQLMDA